MKINIICIGKIKEKYLIDAINEYKKRLSKYIDLDIIELKEESLQVENETNICIAKKKECERINEILEKSSDQSKSYNIALCIDGKELNTIELCDKINDLKVSGKSKFNFIIGGSYGLDKSYINKIDFCLSFSKLTFPHQLFRVILLEQLYRICKIENNELYHK